MVFPKSIFPVFFVPMLVLLGACSKSSGGFSEPENSESAQPVITLDGGTSSASEPNGNGSFRLILSVAPRTDLKVKFGITGTASAGADYKALGSEIIVPAGQTSVTISVEVLDDNIHEETETVVLTLASGSGYILDPTKSATVSIIDNDPLPGSTPEIDILRGSAAIADGGTDAVTSSVAGQAQTLTYTIKNSGNVVLTLGTFAASAAVNSSVSITTQPSASIAAGQSSTFVVSVTPTANGAWSFVVSVANNDADENPYNWTIQGTAGAPLPTTSPEISVVRDTQAVADGSTDQITATVPAQAKSVTYAIQNTGTAVLSVDSFTASSANNCTITIVTQPSTSIATGQSSNLVVSVTPTAQGNWSCVLSAVNNDADESPYNWTIQGTAQSGSTALVVTSSTFVNGGTIPVRCSYTGGNKSPALTWAGAPSSALSFVVIMDDLDADFWVHWNVFKIPSATTSLPEGGPLPTGAVPGKSTGGETGYEGVDPPSGTHRYTIAVYALSIANIQVPTTAKTRSAFQTEFGSYIVAKGEITGFYTAGTSPAPFTAGTNN